jgi:hypothetical protein
MKFWKRLVAEHTSVTPVLPPTNARRRTSRRTFLPGVGTSLGSSGILGHVASSAHDHGILLRHVAVSLTASEGSRERLPFLTAWPRRPLSM